MADFTRIWFMADSHYGQTNIVAGVSKWNDKSQCRDFSTVNEMNDVIVDNINKVVGEDDVLYHLGDWAMGKVYNINELRYRIKCKEVHLVLGNHDKEIRVSQDLQSLFASVNKKLSINIGDVQIEMDHFPNLIWDRHHYGSWHLHGHSHGSLCSNVEYYKRMVVDVGIDTHPEFRPYSFMEVSEIMSKKSVTILDHHGKNKTTGRNKKQ